MIMIESNHRLGAPDSKNGIQSLKKHPFFSAIDFGNLNKYNLKELLEMDEQYMIDHNGVSLKKQPYSMMIPETVPLCEIVCRGILLKKNKWL